MLLTVGVSVAILNVRAVVDLWPSERGSIEVWTESFGLFAGGWDEGIIDRLIAAAVDGAAGPAAGPAAVVAGGNDVDVERESCCERTGGVVRVRS